jgi:hypothetical protein
MRFTHRKDGRTYLVIWWLKLPYRRWLAKRYPQHAKAILNRRCSKFITQPKHTTITFLPSPEAVVAMKKQLGRDQDSDSRTDAER